MDKLNQWLTLLANIGVLFGIFFLAYEIQQNTNAVYSQTRASIFAGSQEELWKNMEYPDVTINMQITDHKLSIEEKIRFDAWMTAAMKAREFAWLQRVSGNIDERQWETELLVIPIILSGQRSRVWWNAIGRDAFNTDFVKFVDQLIPSKQENDFTNKVFSLE